MPQLASASNGGRRAGSKLVGARKFSNTARALPPRFMSMSRGRIDREPSDAATEKIGGRHGPLSLRLDPQDFHFTLGRIARRGDRCSPSPGVPFGAGPDAIHRLNRQNEQTLRRFCRR